MYNRSALPAWLFAIFCAAAPSHGMTIDYVWTGSGVAPADVQSAFNGVSAIYAGLFRDPITVTIDFNFGSIGNNAGENSPSLFTFGTDNLTAYTDIRGALQADQTTSLDNVAVSHLPASEPAVFGTRNPVFSSAELKALGGTGSSVDGSITFSSSLYSSNSYYFRGNGAIAPGQIDFWAVLMHETDEELGTFSLVGNASYYSVADLFRYDSAGRSFTTSASDLAFLSVDGLNPIVYYNQSGTGDFGDFVSGCPSNPHVQDWSACPGQIINLGKPELSLLDAIGYDPVVPEPGTFWCFGGGAILAIGRRRLLRRRGRYSASGISKNAIALPERACLKPVR